MMALSKYVFVTSWRQVVWHKLRPKARVKWPMHADIVLGRWFSLFSSRSDTPRHPVLGFVGFRDLIYECTIRYGHHSCVSRSLMSFSCECWLVEVIWSTFSLDEHKNPSSLRIACHTQHLHRRNMRKELLWYVLIVSAWIGASICSLRYWANSWYERWWVLARAILMGYYTGIHASQYQWLRTTNV